MKLRKIMATVLAAALTLGCCGGALAEGQPTNDPAADAALREVTAKVKTTLNLDTEKFKEFSGWADEDVLLGKRWHLDWNGDGVSLSITADDSGKIYSYNYSEAVSDTEVNARYFGGKLNIPQLPQDKTEEAHKTAQDFLNQVLVSPETVELENDYKPALNRSSYRYSGVVLLNGLEAPINCSVTVRASDLTVTRFWRSDERSGYLGELPGKDTTVTEAQARGLLKGTLGISVEHMEYVADEGGKTAQVRYVPAGHDDYYVDGVTGQLVNLTELREKLWETGDGSSNRFGPSLDAAAPEAATSMKAELTQAEQEGAAKLEGVLAKEQLAEIVTKAWPEIGLDTYTLSAASFSVTEKDIPENTQRTPADYDVSCRLTFGKKAGDEVLNKYVTVDAKTGELKSLRSSRYSNKDMETAYTFKLSAKAGETLASKVLASYAGDNFAKLKLFETQDGKADKNWQHFYTFDHFQDGYFYHPNSYSVAIDTEGTISYLSGSFDTEIQLITPKKVVSVDVARDAYQQALDLRYGYLEVPVSVSLAAPELRPLLEEAGYGYVNSLKNGFVLVQPKESYVAGVLAETGEAVVEDYSAEEEAALTYDDLDNSWVKNAAQQLAVFGIGLRGGSLKPAQKLTQLDMVALLASVDGYFYDPTQENQDALNGLYSYAYSLGIVTPETRKEDKEITRGELVKLILDGAGYKKIAALKGIFQCDFSDTVAEADVGYAALAQGLGLVKGGTDGAYAGGRVATRAEAVAMLYQYMK